MRGIIEQILSVGFIVGIVGNLVASALWAIPALIHIHKKLDRHHRRVIDEIRLGRHNNDGTNGSPSSDIGSSSTAGNQVD